MFVRCTVYEIWISLLCCFGVDQPFCYVVCEHLHNLEEGASCLTVFCFRVESLLQFKILLIIKGLDIHILGWTHSCCHWISCCSCKKNSKLLVSIAYFVTSGGNQLPNVNWPIYLFTFFESCNLNRGKPAWPTYFLFKLQLLKKVDKEIGQFAFGIWILVTNRCNETGIQLCYFLNKWFKFHCLWFRGNF